MRRASLVLLGFCVAWAAGAGVATATLPLQKQAKDGGVKDVNCQSCHVDKIPKKGAATLNDKGKWMMAEKTKRKAKDLDGAWLKDYVVPK